MESSNRDDYTARTTLCLNFYDQYEYIRQIEQLIYALSHQIFFSTRIFVDVLSKCFHFFFEFRQLCASLPPIKLKEI